MSGTRNGKRKTLVSARCRFKEACADALAEAAQMPAFTSAQRVWVVPSDLAAHGFSVHLDQGSNGVWSIEIERRISGMLFTAEGRGSSLLAALKELTTNAATSFDDAAHQIDNPPAVFAA